MLPSDHAAVVERVVEHPLPYFSLLLDAPPGWAELAAGQFVMVRAGDGLAPFLRRAFSVHDASSSPAGARIELLIKAVGPGTRALAGARPGDRLSVLGPLGHGFSLPAEGPVALVAGGIGSAPLYLLGRRLVERGVRFDLFYGGRGRADLPCLERFAVLARRSGGRLVATTEDGSAGERGLVTGPFERSLAAGEFRFFYACGPMGLLARLAALSAAHGVAGEAALETAMGCGFGACLGCAVPRPDGRFALCCQDGPVFPFSEVAW
ncbi:MAG: dihydroorotate dehydrogenase electron transfer subunit [Thermoanaerobaculia bacterium]|nr:dihydroorotate dehydrogenase electron transfer subunit [Thermoanaerobaculia bacterium]